MKIELCQYIKTNNKLKAIQFDKDRVVYWKLFNILYDSIWYQTYTTYFSEADIKWIREVEENVKVWDRDWIALAVQKTIDKKENINVVDPREFFEMVWIKETLPF